MLNSIIEAVSAALRNAGAQPVYSAFDAVPAERKDKGIYTVVGIDSFESTAPVYSQYVVYIPFKSELSIKVTAPPAYPASVLCDYYSMHVAPAVEAISGLECSLKKLSVKFDSNIQRLVLSAVLSAGGITRIERDNV